VARNKLRNFLTARKLPGRSTGDAQAQHRMQELPAREEEQSAWWDQEYERRVFAWAAEQVRGAFQDSTWQAFWQTVVNERKAKEVAAELGMTTNAVYLARRRVLERLREEFEDLLDDVSNPDPSIVGANGCGARRSR